MSNKMQRYTVYFIWKLLYKFRVVSPPIIRSANNWYLSHRYCYLPLYVQQDATLHSLVYLQTALHVSVGTSTHHQERKQLYLQHLVFFTPSLQPAAIVEEVELPSNSSTIAAGSSNSVTNTRCCRYSCLRS